MMPIRRVVIGCLGSLVLVPPGTGTGQAVRELALQETLRVDGNAMGLVSVLHAVEGPDGSVVVSQPMDATIRQFLKDGTAGWTAGGAGDGPGEFRSISKMGRLGDAIWVVDSRSGRISFFDSSGQLLRDERLPQSAGFGAASAASEVSYGFVGPMASYDDGSFLAVLALRMPPATTNLTEYARVDDGGTIVNMVAASTSARGFFVKTNGGSAGASLPFQHRTFVSASAGGRYLVVATPRTEGDRASIDVDVLLPTGDTLFNQKVRVSSVRIPSDTWKEAVRKRSLRFSPDLRDEYARQAEKNAPRVFPFLEGAVVTDDGRVWLTLRADGETRRLFFLGDDGGLVGRAEVPEQVRVVAAYGDTLIAVEVDEYDVESIVRYEIVGSR
jgi:hypothetical protein